MSRWQRPRARWRWAHRGAALLFLALLVLGAHTGFEVVRGSYTATRLLEVVPVADPLAALEVIAASRTLELDLVLGVLLTAGGAVLLGPFFCGWICPIGLLTEVFHKTERFVNGKLFKIKVKIASPPKPFLPNRS